MSRSSNFRVLALALAAFAGCGEGSPAVLPGGQSPPTLRRTISVDLAQVASFASLSGSGSSRQALRAAASGVGIAQSALESGDYGLLALTLSGETLEVSFVEADEPGPGMSSTEPLVEGIFPTSSWVLFAVREFAVNVTREDGTTEQVACSTIAARRADGALYCAPFGFSPENPGDPGGMTEATAHANAAGDLVYVLSRGAERDTVYQLALDAAQGPAATPVSDGTLYPWWFLTNAAGDVMVHYYRSATDRSMTTTQIVPVGGGAPFTMSGSSIGAAIRGEVGAADEDAFYATEGGGDGRSFDGTMYVVSKNGGSWNQATEVVDLPALGVAGCWDLYRLAGRVYTFCGQSLVPVLENGVAVASPTPVPLTGVDRVVQLRGWAAVGQLIIYAATGSGYKFVRHDGTTQQDIEIEAGFDLLRFTVAPSGAIDFLGLRTATQEKVRGTVPAGSTEASYTPAGTVDPAQVIAFTRIN